MNRQQRRAQERAQRRNAGHGVAQWLAVVQQARAALVGRRVQVCISGSAYGQCGCVESVSDEGDVLVALDPGSSQVAVMCSLGMVDQALRPLE